MKASEVQMVLAVVKVWWLVCFQSQLVNGKHALCDGDDMSRPSYEVLRYVSRYCTKWPPRSVPSVLMNRRHDYFIDDGQ